MEQDLETRLTVLEEKIDLTYRSVEKLRRYFQITMWVTIAVIVLPAIGLMFAIPMFVNSTIGQLDGLL